MATIKDVAKHTGLSIATISKFINGGNVKPANKILIEEAIDTLDYKINETARSLKTNKTMTVGVLIPSLENIFFTTIISKLEDVLQKKGYGIIVSDFKEDKKLEKKRLEFLMSKNVDGIVMVSYGADCTYVKELIDKGIPIVLLDRIIKGLTCDVVLADNMNASYDAIESLIVRGHKEIGIICGPEPMYTAAERKKGYLHVHEDYDISLEENYIKHGDYTVESGYKLFRELWELEKPPTAIFVTNYEMTIGAIMAINELNIRMPQDLSLIGFDNIHMARIVNPPLSVVEQPIAKIGEAAANILLKRLEGDYSTFPVIKRLKTKLLLKESVAIKADND